MNVIASLYTDQHLTEDLRCSAQARKCSRYRDILRVIASPDAAYSVMLVHSQVR